MNKHEFLKTLSNHLYFLTVEERAEILNDYEEHFRMGIAAGKSEFKIAAELGDPAVIAEQYKEEGRYYAAAPEIERERKADREIKTAPPKKHLEEKESESPFYESTRERSGGYRPEAYAPQIGTAQEGAPKRETDFLWIFKKLIRFVLRVIRGAAKILRYPFIVLFILAGIAGGVAAAMLFGTFLLRIGGVFLSLGCGVMAAVAVAAMAKVVIALADYFLNVEWLQTQKEEAK